MIKEETLRDLDYFKVLNLIENFSNSEATKEAIGKIRPYLTVENCNASLKEFQEIKEYFDKGGSLPISSFPSIHTLIERAYKEGVFFEAWELAKFLKILRILENLSPYLETISSFPHLSKKIMDILGNQLTLGQPFILSKLEDALDDEGNILDTASSLLAHLRKVIKITEEKIREKLEEILNRKETSAFLQDRFITKRNDRWVIPVRMDSKGQIRGKVQDVSRSGETAFIEPEEVASLSKKLEELKIEERLEEIRILRELSTDIHYIANTLEKQFNLLVYLDKMKALYEFSKKFNGEIPQITDEKRINLINARHPFLMLSKDFVEPLNLELRDKKVLVITGPNAGGKTVTLKTIGLLTLMAISGIPIPASSSSVIPFVKSIYVDLYHEGSIEEQLSSFASHVITLKEIIERADESSLVLLDEVGTNTDPEEGSALACVILEELKKRNCLTFVTTHLSKVKIFAFNEEGMEVAAMLFDEKSMTPLYKLSVGSLTTSYALEVAKKYGFPEKLIKRAYELKGTEDRKLYQLMNELETSKEDYWNKIREIEDIKKNLLNQKEKLERELLKIEETKKKTLEEAKKEAYNMLTKIKKELNLIYEEAKKADRKKLKELSKKLSDLGTELHEQKEKKTEVIKEGDTVRIGELNLTGKVLSIEGDRAKIQTDTLQVEAKLEELEKIENQRETEGSSNKIFFPKKESDGCSLRKLDIRGQRVEEAIPLVERFLNELSMDEISMGIIVHGIGKGILRNSIRDYLKDHPVVKNFRKGIPDEGGDGVTVVETR